MALLLSSRRSLVFLAFAGTTIVEGCTLIADIDRNKIPAAASGGGGAGGKAGQGGSPGDAGAGGTDTGGTSKGGSGGTATGGVGDAGGIGGAAGEAGSAGESGGPSATGGANTGGVSTGGTKSGTGGKATGGVSTGGVSTGGVNTGGVSTGGKATGGVSTGGVSTGGVSTGGASTGGASNVDAGAGGEAGSGGEAGAGGAAGAGSGGTSSGGAATGGTGGTDPGATGGAGGAGGADSGSWTFDADAEGWANTFLDSRGSATPLSKGDVSVQWTPGVGDPGGALEVTVDFAEPEQYAGIGVVLAAPLDLTNAVLSARVQLSSGFWAAGDLEARLFLRSGAQLDLAHGTVVAIDAEAEWLTVTFDASSPEFSEPGFDITSVREIGVEFDTSVTSGSAATAVFLIDTVEY